MKEKAWGTAENHPMQPTYPHSFAQSMERMQTQGKA